MELENKHILVTGAASGIGAAATRLFVERGARVFAADVNETALSHLADTSGGAVIPYTVDLADMAEVEAMVNTAVETFGSLDVLVNNAGVGHVGRAADVSLDDWRRVMAIDLDAVFVACKCALPSLIQSRGNIVCTASISGMAADFGFPAYNTAKAGVIALVRNMAVDYAPNVRVNTVSPGFTLTGMMDAMPQSTRDAFTAEVPMQRAAQPCEIAEAIAFLASERASFITGQNIVVDGGMMARTGQPSIFAQREKREATEGMSS